MPLDAIKALLGTHAAGRHEDSCAPALWPRAILRRIG